MLTSRKLARTGLGAALALSLVSASAFAAPATTAATATYNGNAAGQAVTYATQAITSAAVIVTAPFSTVFKSGAVAGAITTQTSNVTFTLPGSLTFASIPTASCTITGAATCTSVQLSGVGGAVVGTNTVTVQFTYTASAAGEFISPAIGQFTFTNASVLNTATATALKITASTTDANLIAAAEKPTAEFASSASSLTFSAANSTNPLAIDIVTSGVLGKKFLQNAVNSLTGEAGVLTITLGAQKGADGLAAFTFGGATGVVTISGNFNNIASAFLAKGGQADCLTATSPVSSATGPFAGSIVFQNVTVPVTSSTTRLCLVANSTGVIGANAIAPTASITVGSTTQSATATTAGQPLLDAYTFNGGVQTILLTGIVSGYPMFLRVVNNSATTATVTALFQSDGGIITSTPVVTNLAAGANKLVAVSTLLTAAGVEAANGNLASLLTLAPSTSVQVSQFVFNPGGVFVQIGSGTSP